MNKLLNKNQINKNQLNTKKEQSNKEELEIKLDNCEPINKLVIESTLTSPIPQAQVNKDIEETSKVEMSVNKNININNIPTQSKY